MMSKFVFFILLFITLVAFIHFEFQQVRKQREVVQGILGIDEKISIL